MPLHAAHLRFDGLTTRVLSQIKNGSLSSVPEHPVHFIDRTKWVGKVLEGGDAHDHVERSA
jgi:hypothetical protein